MGAAACIAEGRDMDCGAGVQRDGELKQFALPHDVTHVARPPKRTKPAEYGGIRGRGKYAPQVLEQALRDIASQFHQKRLQAGASLNVLITREDLKDGGGTPFIDVMGKVFMPGNGLGSGQGSAQRDCTGLSSGLGSGEVSGMWAGQQVGHYDG